MPPLCQTSIKWVLLDKITIRRVIRQVSSVIGFCKLISLQNPMTEETCRITRLIVILSKRTHLMLVWHRGGMCCICYLSHRWLIKDYCAANLQKLHRYRIEKYLLDITIYGHILTKNGTNTSLWRRLIQVYDKWIARHLCNMLAKVACTWAWQLR